jgi:hypothetical protein
MKKVVMGAAGFALGYVGGAVLAKMTSLAVLQYDDQPTWLWPLRYFPMAGALIGAAVMPALFRDHSRNR